MKMMHVHSIAITGWKIFEAIVSAMSLIVAASNVFICFYIFFNNSYPDHYCLDMASAGFYLHLSLRIGGAKTRNNKLITPLTKPIVV
jgi:hypothetical protein